MGRRSYAVASSKAFASCSESEAYAYRRLFCFYMTTDQHTRVANTKLTTPLNEYLICAPCNKEYKARIRSSKQVFKACQSTQTNGRVLFLPHDSYQEPCVHRRGDFSVVHACRQNCFHVPYRT